MTLSVTPYKDDTSFKHQPISKTIIRDLTLDTKKSFDIFQQHVQSFDTLKVGGSVVVAQMLPAFKDEKRQAAVTELAVRLVNEYYEKKGQRDEGLLPALKSLFFGATKKVSAPMDNETKRTFVSEEFQTQLPFLPSFSEVLQKFPEMVQTLKSLAQQEAEIYKEVLTDFTDKKIKAVLSENKNFCDAVTKEVVVPGEHGSPLRPVHLKPYDKNFDPVTIRTAHQILGNKTWYDEDVKHPTLKDRKLQGFIDAYDTEITMQKTRCQLIDEMRIAFAERNREFFDQALKKYSDHLNESQEYDEENTQQILTSLGNLFAGLEAKDKAAEAAYQVTASLFDVISLEKRVQGREILRNYLIQNAQSNEKVILRYIKPIIENSSQSRPNDILQMVEAKIKEIEKRRIKFVESFGPFVDRTLEEEIKQFIAISGKSSIELKDRIQQLQST